MYRDTPKRSFKAVALKWLCFALVFALVIFTASLFAAELQRDLDIQAAASIKAAVLAAAVQCYAVEGTYPQGLETLEKNYGVQINHDKFIVIYDAFASNLLPEVTLLQR